MLPERSLSTLEQKTQLYDEEDLQSTVHYAAGKALITRMFFSSFGLN
jgi:hypothetical protein